MTSTFHSFDKSPLGVFIKTPLGVRNGLTNLIWCMEDLDLVFTDTDDNVLNVGRLNKETLDKIGLNEGFFAPVTAQRVLQVGKQLFFGGLFRKKRDNTGAFKHIARLDKETGEWVILEGTDIQGVAGLTDIAKFKGNLAVLGAFNDANGVTDTANVAGFNIKTNTWFSIGGTGVLDIGGLNEKLLEYKDELYATGLFFVTGESYFTGVKRFDGISWNEVTPGVQSPFVNTGDVLIYKEVLHFAAFTIDADPTIWAWDNLAYEDIGTFTITSGILNILTGMTIYKGDLIAVGRFDEVTTDTETIAAFNVARFDGLVWEAMGDGLGDGNLIAINDCHVDNGILYLAGNFTENPDAESVIALAKWDPINEKFIAAGNQDDLVSGDIMRLESSTLKLTGGQDEE